ncbi:MAG TPA: HD domain-containing protein [Blastocatellia bacterium]|nr:HD domain-containing protein [Blastocatellia bacterium]
MSGQIVDRLFAIFASKGDQSYFGEPISQTEHALQAACLAHSEGAKETLIAAALLHDIGHLLHELPEDAAESGIDARHERVGQGWLARYFREEVSASVGLHVAAKRYLAYINPEYHDRLSEASAISLRVQGGPLSPEEALDFEETRYSPEAVRLRLWDDRAKVEGLVVPGLEFYRAILLCSIRS